VIPAYCLSDHLDRQPLMISIGLVMVMGLITSERRPPCIERPLTVAAGTRRPAGVRATPGPKARTRLGIVKVALGAAVRLTAGQRWRAVTVTVAGNRSKP
jgi:hypothetical protein